MESTEGNNNKKLSADMQQDGQIDQLENDPMDQPETGRNKLYLQMMLEDYAYCVAEDTVTGMHMAQGKPHHADQMNV